MRIRRNNVYIFSSPSLDPKSVAPRRMERPMPDRAGVLGGWMMACQFGPEEAEMIWVDKCLQ